MKFLLDTNVISELSVAQPDANVVRWFEAEDERLLALSVISVAEVRFGLELLAAGKRKDMLNDWLRNKLPWRFAGRILPVTREIADQAGRLLAAARRKGHNGDFNDALIAATGKIHTLTVVTRNTRDFQHLQSDHANPWLA